MHGTFSPVYRYRSSHAHVTHTGLVQVPRVVKVGTKNIAFVPDLQLAEVLRKRLILTVTLMIAPSISDVFPTLVP